MKQRLTCAKADPRGMPPGTRKNFQFTGQRFFAIENGRLAGQLKDVAYQVNTTDFWGRWRPSAARRPTSSVGRSTAARPSLGRSRRSATAARPH
jgi:predicted Zn-dependent protease